MKKKAILSFILSCSMLFGSSVCASDTCKKGDANMDGDIDHADLYEIKEILLLGSGCDTVPECADYDGDGSVTVVDVQSVLAEIIRNCVPGDANTSGHLTLSDICTVNKMISKKKYSTCADCNKDGKLTDADVICIQSRLNHPSEEKKEN